MADTLDLGYAKLDLDRRRRCGMPEVIFAEGKRTEWLLESVEKMHTAGEDVFATRLNAEQTAALVQHFPQGTSNNLARSFWWPQPAERILIGNLAIVTAGTSDLPVAHEALATATAFGVNAAIIADVGVAGLHRILAKRAEINTADVVIVVAGMDGALPSVVGGLVDAPVIAVPTSIGYGASFGGVAALLTMLNSCSASVAVVNIDSGFKAAAVASRIIARIHTRH
jgi:hypothetical protein